MPNQDFFPNPFQIERTASPHICCPNLIALLGLLQVLKRPTYSSFIALLDNYVSTVNDVEVGF